VTSASRRSATGSTSTDRRAPFIFGDGAGAVSSARPTSRASADRVGLRRLALEAITNKHSWIATRNDPDVGWPYLTMQGQRVFRWAVWQMAPVARQALDAAGMSVDDLDAFIPHQANMRITDAMIKAIKLPPHVAIARDIAYTGNTSAASVPLAMQQMLESGEAKSGGTALLIGFGAGLAYAAQVVTLP
jgi:3-oxoacyl-[acyl-carrier-protein] synthase-3